MEPSISLIKTANSGSCMIISHFNSENSYILWFDYINGHPIHYGIPGYDVFPNEAEAKQYISSISKIDRENQGQYLIGINNIKNRYLIISVITKAIEVGKILGKYGVYSIVNYTNFIVALDNESSTDEQIADQEKQFFTCFPISELHFFCPTFDLTSILGSPTNQTMIWNLSLSMPFKKFQMPCCIDLIQGSFMLIKVAENVILYSIIRKCCRFYEPFFQEETKEEENFVNEIEIEFVIESFNNGIYETKSHVLRRCVLPHLMLSERLTPNKATVIYSGVFDRLINLYQIQKISFIDLSDPNSSNQNDSIFLKNVISLISGVFDVELHQFDWNLQSQNDVNKAANNLLNILIPIVDKYGFNLNIWENGIPRSIQKQKGFFIVSDQNGFDQSTFGAFLIGLYSLSRIMYDLNITQIIPKNIEILRQFVHSKKLFNFFILSNRKLGQLSIVPTNFNERDLAILAGSKEANSLERQNYQVGNSTREIVRAFLSDLKSTYTFANEACVSIVPAAHVVFPPTLNLKIFSLLRNEFCFINTKDPIVISLGRPCFITKIIFKIIKISNSNYNFAKPASVTIYGGMYMNTMFPLFEDVLFVNNESIKAITVSKHHQNNSKYHTKVNLNEIEKVRFLQFKFNSNFPRVTISNIYVYGNCDMKKKTDLKRILTDNMNNMNSYKQVQLPTFSEEANPDSVTSWEKQRLYSFLSFNDFAFKMIERKLNPFQMTVSSLVEIKKYKISSPGKISCSNCSKKKSVYQCGMCSRFYCNSCKPQIETKILNSENKSITVQICSDCFEIRNKILKITPLLEFLKARMIVNLYPFIGKFDSIVEGNGYQNEGNLIGTLFISKPPNGVKSSDNEPVPSEVILDPSNKNIWSPRESCIPLLIYLKQMSNINSISIRCKSPVKVIFEDQQLEFIPPLTEHELINYHSVLILKMTLIGFPIEIQNISVFGSPVPFQFSNYSISPNSCPARSKEIQCRPTLYRDLNMIQYKLDQQEIVTGLFFDEIIGNQTIFFEYINENNKRAIIPLNFPKGRFSSCSIELPQSCKTKEFNLWFSSAENQSKNVKISPLCISRNASMTSSIIHLNL